jgi:two-component system, cell cycle response regulator
MPGSYKNEEEPVLARESLFRQKLSQLRSTGEIQRTTISSHHSGFRAIEQTHYLNNVCDSFQHTDPRQLESLALLDVHTELYNHDTLCRVLKDEFRRAQRYKNSLAVLAIAIDALPQLADHIDAIAFDALLKTVAQFLMKAVRDVDIPGRYDMERFVIICPQTNLDGALSLAGRLCASIESEEFCVPREQSHVTLSIGMATFPDLADGYEKLLHLAMQSLTVAKQSGGNTFKIITT